MSGLIRVNTQQTWIGANWVFERILTGLRKYLPAEGSARIIELIDGIVPGLNSLSLEHFTPAEMMIFRKALEAAYDEVFISGKTAFAEPSFYPGFMAGFEELRKMIRTDERSRII